MFQSDSTHHVAKQASNLPEILPYESVLAEGLRGFLSELVMVNGAVMVSYICNNQHANLDDIIVSSSECAIKPGRLHYGNHAHIEFDWGKAPSVAISMELRDDRLTAFFEVVLGDDHVGVDIRAIHFVDFPGDAEAKLRRFAAAVADAGLTSGEPNAPVDRGA
jgi:hypothetical protein